MLTSEYRLHLGDLRHPPPGPVGQVGLHRDGGPADVQRPADRAHLTLAHGAGEHGRRAANGISATAAARSGLAGPSFSLTMSSSAGAGVSMAIIRRATTATIPSVGRPAQFRGDPPAGRRPARR
jgi:hypothetical protein